MSLLHRAKSCIIIAINFFEIVFKFYCVATDVYKLKSCYFDFYRVNKFSGTKKDLRVSNDKRFVTQEDAKKLKRRIGAVKTLECSALTYEGLDEIFVEAVRAASEAPKKPFFLTRCFK